jgi:hypothetical protein
MALTCPHCGVLNRCDCKNCNPDKDPKNLVIIDYDNECYQCYSCNQKFSEQDSLDYDWDKMHLNIKNTITPEMCLIWISLVGKERKQYEKDSPYGSYGFESAFFQHFRIRHSECGNNELASIKIQIQRENKLKQIIK